MPLPKRISPRWKEYDYSSPGGYFVTICTKNREHYFGEIVGRDGLEGRPQTMALNALGKYCAEQIQLISENRRTVEIHEYVVMPNHVHILLLMSGFEPGMDNGYQINGHAASVSLPTGIVKHENYEGPKLGNIINAFKGNVTKFAIQNNIPFAWQSRYHDHIIRTAEDHDCIKYYIQTNPANWDQDIFHI